MGIECGDEQVDQTLRATARRSCRNIRFADFEGLLEAFGWQHRRTKGSHRHYSHPSVPAVLTINPDGKAAHRYQVRLLLELVEEYGLHMRS